MDTLYLPHILRGRNIIQNIDAKNKIISTLLNELEDNNWIKNKLSKKYNSLLEDYKLETILPKLKEAKKEKWSKIIKNEILKLYGNEIGNKYICIYLVAYCTNLNLEYSLKKNISKLCKDNGVNYSDYKLKQIINSGISDGVYLGILNEDGSIRDKTFFKNWIYIKEDDVLNNVLRAYKRKLDSKEYNEKVHPLYNNRYYLKKQIKMEDIQIQSPYIIRKKVKKDDKIRTVYKIKEYSLTEIAMKYLKKRLDKVFNIEYSNRDKIMRKLFSLMENINVLDDYTIYRFDIKDFFDSVNSKIIIEKYILDCKLNEYEKNILKKLSDVYKWCFAGLPTSNALIEIAGRKFDEMIQFNLMNDGIIFYSRYVDDGLIILNRKVDKKHIDKHLKNVLKNCFNENIKFNKEKEKYFTKTDNEECFTYLGYQFNRTKNNDFIFGIEKKKIDKYKHKIDQIVDAYLKDRNIELFRQRLIFFISRIVFYYNDNSRYSSLGNWDVRGITYNYCFLRNHIKKGEISYSTQMFLKSEIMKNVQRKTRGKLPYFLKGEGKNYYSLEYGIKENKSIVFHPNIGWSQEYLKNKIRTLGYKDKLIRKSYQECVKIYCSLIRL